MKLLAGQTDEASLSRLGEEAVSLLEKGEFQLLADRFGYVLACGGHPATVIEKELQACITEFQNLPNQGNLASHSTIVKYFNPNDSGLYAVVECIFIASKGCPMLVELIITSEGEDKYASLEEVSLAVA